MARQYWVNPYPPIHLADGTALASSTTLTDISPLPNITIPGNTLEVGQEFDLLAECTFSTTGTPTLLVGFYLGGVAGTAIAASSAITTGTGAAAWSIIMRYRGRLRAVGTSGSLVGQGELLLGTSLTAFSSRPIPEVAASRTITWDTTASKAITVGAQWGTSSASNTITCNEISLLVLD